MWQNILIIIFLPTFVYVLIKASSKTKFFLNLYIFNVVMYITFSAMLPYFLFRPKNVHNGKIAAIITKKIMEKILNIKWILRNPAVLEEERGAVIVSNHQHSLDILGMMAAWTSVGRLAIISKMSLLFLVPMGTAMYLSGTIFVDRTNPRAAYKKLEEASDLMTKRKTKIWVFPEGTRNKDCKGLLPFKKGGFNIAVAAQVPIIPVVFSPYYFINNNKYTFDNGHVILQTLEPISTVGMTIEDVPDLIAKVHKEMSIAYTELSKEVISKPLTDNRS